MNPHMRAHITSSSLNTVKMPITSQQACGEGRPKLSRDYRRMGSTSTFHSLETFGEQEQAWLRKYLNWRHGCTVLFSQNGTNSRHSLTTMFHFPKRQNRHIQAKTPSTARFDTVGGFCADHCFCLQIIHSKTVLMRALSMNPGTCLPLKFHQMAF